MRHTVQCRVIASVKAGSQYDAGSVSIANIMVIEKNNFHQSNSIPDVKFCDSLIG